MGLSPLVYLYLSSLRLIPKNSDFCAQRINIGDVMPVEFYFFRTFDSVNQRP